MSSDVAESHDDLTSVGALTVTTVVELPDGVSVEDAIAELSVDPNVTVVEPDYVVHTAEVSDDPLFVGGELWGMEGRALRQHVRVRRRRGGRRRDPRIERRVRGSNT